MIAPRILHAAANWRPSAPSVLQNCSKTSRCMYTSEMGFGYRCSNFLFSVGKLHGFASSSSLGQLNTPSFSTYTWKSKFDDILKQVSTQNIPKNAAQSPTPSPGNSLLWLRPSAVRLAKVRLNDSLKKTNSLKCRCVCCNILCCLVLCCGLVRGFISNESISAISENRFNRPATGSGESARVLC